MRERVSATCVFERDSSDEPSPPLSRRALSASRGAEPSGDAVLSTQRARAGGTIALCLGTNPRLDALTARDNARLASLRRRRGQVPCRVHRRPQQAAPKSRLEAEDRDNPIVTSLRGVNTESFGRQMQRSKFPPV